MSVPSERLTVQLEAAAVRAIRAHFADLNHAFFKDRLRSPVIELTDARSHLGRWVRGTRRIEISRTLLLDHGWGVLVEVLKHEMAHQYTDEVLGAVDEAAHGRTFRMVCEERGIDGRAAGVPEPSFASHAPILERIAKLLALAESSNENEAQAAMSAAQRLMLKHNLEELVGGRADARYTHRHLGPPTGRVAESERVLANILTEHFFVDAIWVPVWRPREGKRGSVLEICGRLENVEMAEYVHAFLRDTAARLWKEHRTRAGIRTNRDRRAFLAGVMEGFLAKLDEQGRKNQAEGLVWVGDPAVARLFKQRHPRVRWTRHQSSRGTRAHTDGAVAGRSIVLHRGVKQGASGAVRLLRGR